MNAKFCHQILSSNHTFSKSKKQGGKQRYVIPADEKHG
jgi:hypothetical protein